MYMVIANPAAQKAATLHPGQPVEVTVQRRLPLNSITPLTFKG